MKKAMSVFLVVLVLVCGVTSCVKNGTFNGNQRAVSDDVGIVGGYNIENTVAGNVPDYEKKAFDEAVKGVDDTNYDLLACIGVQVVAGRNYFFLAKTQKTDSGSPVELHVVKVYEALNGTSELTSERVFLLTDYIKNGTIDVALPDSRLGGINVFYDGGMTSMPQRLATATSKAFTSFDKMFFEPLACVGQQVVAGTNYALICRGSATAHSETAGLFMVVIYCDLQDNAEIISVCPVTL